MRIGGGTKGKTFSDRQLAGDVRNMALGHLKKVLDVKYPDKEYQKQVLLRLAPSLLPKLNEVTGADGKELPQPIINVNGILANDSD